MRRKGPIVVVDDDPDDQYLYSKAFEKLHLENQIIVFDNGMDALEYFEKTAVDPFIILCDINMPIMDGLQLREAMCSNPSVCKKNIPFIFMSTSARQSDIDKATSLYTHGFFQKEISYERHESILKRIIDYWDSCRFSERVAA
jgi:CheY-like chemotaxis protein